MRQWLVEIRSKQGLSQAEVAKRAKISQPSFCAIERGDSTPKPGTAMRIAEVLGCQWTEFYQDKEGTAQ